MSFNSLKLDHRVVLPGRIKTYLNNPEKGTLPVACRVVVYRNNLGEFLVEQAKALCYGAGVKVVLDEFVPRKSINVVWKFWISPEHPDFPYMTQEQREHYLNDAPSFGQAEKIIFVADSMEEGQFDSVSIEQSWIEFINAAIEGKKIIVDLSALRPSGITNHRGLVATGALGSHVGVPQSEIGTDSFLSIYEAIADHLESGDIQSLLVLLGQLCKVIRRGGTYKNGIITTAMSWKHPQFVDYMTFPLEFIPGGSKKSVRLTHDVVHHPELLDLIVDGVNRESVFLEKIVSPTHYLNVCVSGDSWIQTTEGAKHPTDLIGVPFTAVVDGMSYPSTSRGFWSNGLKSVITLETEEGYELTLTPDHKVQKATRRGYWDQYSYQWVEVQSLQPGDKIRLHNHRSASSWNGAGNFDQGWLIGYLIGDGSLTKTGAVFPFWGESRQDMLEKTILKLEKECMSVSDRNCFYWHDGKYPDQIRSDRNVPKVCVASKEAKNLASKFGVTQAYKQANEILEKTSSDFHRGFIQGLFDADSCVSLGQKNGSGRSIQFTSINMNTARTLQRMLLRLGIKSQVYVRNEGGSVREFPDGKYETKQAYRLDITGDNILQYAEKIGYSDFLKTEKLQTLVNSYKRGSYGEKFLATVKSVKDSGTTEVFDCTIQDAHCFDANGIFSHNCMGILLQDKGACLVAHANAGRCANPEELIEAYVEATITLAEIHQSWRKQNPDKSGIYRSFEDDRQIAVGWLGFANFLAQQNVSYRDFAKALEAIAYGKPYVLDGTNHQPYLIARALKSAYEQAARICLSYGIERFATIEPNQRCWIDEENKDLRGGYACRSIDPPFARRERRDSDTDSGSSRWYDHKPVETMQDVDHELRQRIWEAWQYLADKSTGGMAHAQSFDLTKRIDREWLIDFVTRSPLKSTYYQFASRIDQTYLNKGTVIEACDVTDPTACASCGAD